MFGVGKANCHYVNSKLSSSRDEEMPVLGGLSLDLLFVVEHHIPPAENHINLGLTALS